MKEVGEIDAEGKGLFKFDATIKAYQGEILQMIANPTNKAGSYPCTWLESGHNWYDGKYCLINGLFKAEFRFKIYHHTSLD
mmetsp:Transcript_4427/g.4572  ORF Transcript_4427/g.4572 Transcript_4427/m.4572 type:complete len:81 (+) Transcript_4427:107-349(+)